MSYIALKVVADITTITLLNQMFTTQTWQQLLVAVFVVVINVIILPFLSLIFKKLKARFNDKELHDLLDTIQKQIEDSIMDLVKKDKDDKEDKKE